MITKKTLLHFHRDPDGNIQKIYISKFITKYDDRYYYYYFGVLIDHFVLL